MNRLRRLAVASVVGIVTLGACVGPPEGEASPAATGDASNDAPDEWSGNTRLVPQDYATIQEAINAADPGDTISIDGGTYNESLTIDKGLSFVPSGVPIGTPIALVAVGGPAITISGDLDGADVSIAGFEISGGTDGIYVDQAANAGKLTIEDCTISGNSQHGIFVIGDDPDNDGNAPIVAGITNLVVTDTSFENNGFENNLQGSGHIKLFGYGGDALFQNVTIEGAADETAVADRPDNAIEITGYVNNGGANPVSAGAPDIGSVVFDNGLGALKRSSRK